MFGTTKKAHQADFELFSVFDTKVGAYELPMFATNALDLQRSILNTFKDPQQRANKFLMNAEDYQVFRIGSWDKKSGIIQTIHPEHVCNLHDLKVLAQPSGLVNTPDIPTMEMRN